MAKKLSFNDLPSAVERMLEILDSGDSGQTALPEIVQRLARLEKKIEYLQIMASPDKPVMDMQAVCRVLKLKPKAVYELAEAGILPSREQGRKTVFYEEGVVKYYTALPVWKTAAGSTAAPASSASASADTAAADIPSEGRHRIDINAAAEILDRSTAAIYQLISNKRVPFHKDGNKTYFYTDELRAWVKDNPPRKRRKDS